MACRSRPAMEIREEEKSEQALPAKTAGKMMKQKVFPVSVPPGMVLLRPPLQLLLALRMSSCVIQPPQMAQVLAMFHRLDPDGEVEVVQLRLHLSALPSPACFRYRSDVMAAPTMVRTGGPHHLR
ncbi:unnamed protein product [Pleuronectes platessa]|uniref:Uncharacterized protein n=1 Tax=Pleuronectes platessa TaxID=8262 RepID=A0A9N7YLS1_PLEPL|nr:unnamed protein product [Pleuronectes platessa]